MTALHLFQKGLQSAWERVVGVVIQTGVEFGDNVVHDYIPNPALALAIEQEQQPLTPSMFRQTLTRVMKDDDKYWRGYYHGSTDEIDRKLYFSYSDRARYYLGQEDVKNPLNS